MTTTESPLVSLPSAVVGTMDDKKRPAASSGDAQGPPRKKQATDLNGKGKADRDADMPWKDDLEVSFWPSAFILRANHSSRPAR